MKRVLQPVPRLFVMLGGLLVAYLLLPLASLLPRVSIGSLNGLLNPVVLAAAAVSAETATVTSILLLLFGVPLSYLLARRDFRGKTFVTLLVQTSTRASPVGIRHFATYGLRPLCTGRRLALPNRAPSFDRQSGGYHRGSDIRGKPVPDYCGAHSV